jgi:hypothetical protein
MRPPDVPVKVVVVMLVAMVDVVVGGDEDNAESE